MPNRTHQPKKTFSGRSIAHYLNLKLMIRAACLVKLTARSLQSYLLFYTEKCNSLLQKVLIFNFVYSLEIRNKGSIVKSLYCVEILQIHTTNDQKTLISESNSNNTKQNPNFSMLNVCCNALVKTF